MPTPEEEKAAADAKAAADQKVADDAAAKKAADDEAAKNGDENITIKKKDWEKTNSDLDNYRRGLISRKAEDRTLGTDGDTNIPSNGGTPAPLDEKKITEIATRASLSNIYKTNEKAAIKEFLKTHNEYTDDKEWQKLLPFLPANINKEDPVAIVDAIEGALLLHKRASGQLDTYLADQAEKNKQQAEMNARVNLGYGAGGVGSKSNQGNQADKTPESTIEMGKRFGHSTETIEKTLKEVPKGPEGGFQIDVMPSKK